MDDSSFEQLKQALKLTPDNQALLVVIIKTFLKRNEADEAVALLEEMDVGSSDNKELNLLAGKAYLATGLADSTLTFLDSEEPEALKLKAEALLALDRKTDGYEAYQQAISQNSALEDPDLAAALRTKAVELPTKGKGPKLRVLSNDDTDATDLDRLIEPDREAISFKDIGGLDQIKKTIHKKIILPYQKPSLFQRFKKRVGGGVLMYGPPGCGKTMLARATAGECKAEFFNVSISDVLDMYIGESERKLHALFERARQSAPAVLFFDEVEALGGRRQNNRDSSTSKLVSQFLSEMDGFSQNNHGVLILAATNVPWSVDSAFRRPGRFDRVLFVPPPDAPARSAILSKLLDERPTDGAIDTGRLAKKTSGFSGADMRELIETAVDEAIALSIETETEQPITTEHLQAALSEVKPTTLEWLTTARNYARYSNEGGQYNDVLDFLKRYGKE